MFGDYAFGQGYFGQGPGGSGPTPTITFTPDGGGMMVGTQINGPSQGPLIGYGM